MPILRSHMRSGNQQCDNVTKVMAWRSAKLHTTLTPLRHTNTNRTNLHKYSLSMRLSAFAVIAASAVLGELNRLSD